MPTLLRFCLSSLLILSFVLSTTAQRTARRRTVVSSEEQPSPTNNLQDSSKTKTVKTANVSEIIIIKYRCALRTIPGELFSRADHVRSQKELASLQYPSEDNQDVETNEIKIKDIDNTPQKKLTCSFKQESECLLRGEEIVKKVMPPSVEKKIPPTSTDKKMEIPDCKETNPINKAGVADSYPYLTADGLRLYFTSNREGGHGRFFISTRASIKDPFGEPKVLSPNLTDGYYAGTLTADELTLCMVKSGVMYISVRTNRNGEFPLPVKLEGASGNFHFGPSISQDGKEIVVTVSGKNMIRIYKRTDIYSVEEINILAVPPGNHPGPGQLSKDGLSYYFSLKTKDSEHLWRYTKTTNTANFANLEEFPEQIKGLKNIIQPSLNADGSVMVFVTSPRNLWQTNDIALVNNVKEDKNTPGQLTSLSSNEANTMKTMSKTTLRQLKVYPNPFIATINVEIKELPAEGALFNLYDLSGRKIKQEKINNLRTGISFNQLSSGIYAYYITDVNGQLISSGKLVKSQ